jgi:hypothetical protein
MSDITKQKVNELIDSIRNLSHKAIDCGYVGSLDEYEIVNSVFQMMFVNDSINQYLDYLGKDNTMAEVVKLITKAERSEKVGAGNSDTTKKE